MKIKKDYYNELKNHFTNNGKIPFKDTRLYLARTRRLAALALANKIDKNNPSEIVIEKDYNNDIIHTVKKMGEEYTMRLLKTHMIYKDLFAKVSLNDFKENNEGQKLFDDAINENSVGDYLSYYSALNGIACPDMSKIYKKIGYKMAAEITLDSELIHILFIYLTFANFELSAIRAIKPDLYCDKEHYQKLLSTFTTNIEDEKLRLNLPQINTTTLRKIPKAMKTALYEVKVIDKYMRTTSIGESEIHDRAHAIFYFASYFIGERAIQALICKLFEKNLPIDNSYEAWSKIPEKLNPIYNEVFSKLSGLYSKVLELAYTIQKDISYDEIKEYISDYGKLIENIDRHCSEYIPKVREYYKKLGIDTIEKFNDDLSNCEDYYFDENGEYSYKYNLNKFRPGEYYRDRLFDIYMRNIKPKR